MVTNAYVLGKIPLHWVKKESLGFPRDFLLLYVKELYRIKDILSLAIV